MVTDWKQNLEKSVNRSGYRSSLLSKEQEEFARDGDAIVQVMEEVAERLRRKIPRMTVEAYAVASGHQVETRLRCKVPGLGKKIVYMKSKGRIMSMSVISTFVDMLIVDMLILPSECSQIKHDVRVVLCRGLTRELNSVVKSKIDAAFARGFDKSKALAAVESNKRRSGKAAYRGALDRLQNVMETYSYSESDVMEAWRLSQVRRVQNA